MEHKAIMAKNRTARWAHRAEVKNTNSRKAQHPQVKRQIDEEKAQRSQHS